MMLPALDPGSSTLDQAYALIAAGLHVIPTRASDPKNAGSRLGRGWPARSSRDVETVTGWFAGTDDRLAIHCGRSGIVAIDLDHPDRVPDELAKALAVESPPYQSTRPDEPGRGHYLFAQPPGRRIGNRAGGLGREWGEVRGANGIILVGGAGREWLRTGEVPVLPDYVADLVPDVGDAESSVGDDELARFVAAHVTAVSPRDLDRVVGGFERLVERGGSRHDALVSSACWATREVVAGRYPARTAYRRLSDVFVAATAEVGRGRVLSRTDAEGEAQGAIAWAVAQEWRPGGVPPVDPDAPDPARAALEATHTAELEHEVRRERLRREARAVLDAEGREPLRVLSAAEFLDAPAPEYLVPGMLYRDGLAVVFGAPGAAKSFLTLDIAMCLATGTPWRGIGIGRGVVHYVMAEGQATNTLRTMAWLIHNKVYGKELDGFLHVVPQAVVLTEAGVREYLPRVESDKPDLIILDTKNLMFVGKESAGDDFGAMLRVLHALRVAAGGCAVVLVDHTGLGDDSRVRGSNAQRGGVDTEVRVVVTETGTRVATMTRDKSAPDAGVEWAFRLEQVPAVVRPSGVCAPAVCVPVERGERTVPFGGFEDEWGDPAVLVELPGDVCAYEGPGQGAIRALARFMRFSASSGVGFSCAQASAAIRARHVVDGRPRWSADTLQRAWGGLHDLGRLTVAESGGATARSLWTPRDDDPR